MAPSPSASMAQEIAEQPASTARLLAYLLGSPEHPAHNTEQASLDAALRHARRISFAACGSSRHAAMLGRYACLRLAALPADVDEAHELVALGPNVWRDVGLCVVLSQSGETTDTLEALALAGRFATPVLALTNAVPSTLAEGARWAWGMQAGEEKAVPATKSFVAQGIACLLLGLRAARARDVQLGPHAAAMQAARAAVTASLTELPAALTSLLAALNGPQAGVLARAAERVDGAHAPVLLGRGPAAAIAQEGALKLREAAYVPAQAFSMGEFKHGPMAMLEPRRDVVVALLDWDEGPGSSAEGGGGVEADVDDELHPDVPQASATRTVTALQNLAALGVPLVVIAAANNPHLATLRACAKDMLLLTTPASEPLCWTLLAAVVLQKLTLAVAMRRGVDADRPRYLVKSIV